MDKVKTAFNKAKIGIMVKMNSTFITTVLFSLKHSWTTEIPTAGTDGVNLYINPDFFESLSKDEQIGLLAHEAWHVAFQHMFRSMGRDPSLWNQAADYVINLMLKDSKYQIPQGGLCNEAYRDMSTEQVYDILVKDPSKQSSDPDLDVMPPGKLDDDNPEPLTEEDMADLQQGVEDILIKASIQSRQAGDNPGAIPNDIAIHINKLLNPKLPWHVILANYVNSISREDFSFRKPNRRFMPDYYLPSLYSERVGHIAIAVDTSGSVSDMEFAGFLTEINHIKTHMNPELITVLDFDTSIKKVHELKEEDSLSKLQFHGRGGTDLHPVFDYFNKGEPPLVLIVFSDLHCTSIKSKPNYPVVWICINNNGARVNFGKLIHMEIK